VLGGGVTRFGLLPFRVLGSNPKSRSVFVHALSNHFLFIQTAAVSEWANTMLVKCCGTIEVLAACGALVSIPAKFHHNLQFGLLPFNW
jgi:predicted short-subunit dehydrogenase-like oxidoreductase (DUF2520 family)